jgi:NADH-quinone oxidoreductase subunit K
MTLPDDYLVVGAVLFALGSIGFLTRRNLILMMLSAELMLHGVSLSLVAFSAAHGNHQGQAFTIFILTVAACEAGLALALILALYRRRRTLDVNVWSDLGEPVERPRIDDPRVMAEPEPEPEFPHLTPAGVPPLPGRDLTREMPTRTAEARKEAIGRV